jgi:hypothetical protein
MGDMTFHCFFEQSGTFKNEFKKLGYDAYDYDILDDFGETDFKVDLFKEIETAYEGGESVFDSIKEEDQIMAFFPCVRFENQIMLSFRGQAYQMREWSDEQKMKYDMKLLDEVNRMYKLINKLFLICMNRNLKLIVENPYSEEHFLRRYWCIPPTIIDRDRRERGDYFKKPTQYWFINCEPKNNLFFEAMPQNSIGVTDPIRMMKKGDWNCICENNRNVARSMIHPDYANRFIREFII